MTDSIQTRARNAQAESLGTDNPAVLQAAQDLYDSVDALTPEQKTLLIREALVKVSQLAEGMKETRHEPTRIAYGVLAHGVIALAGYAIEQFREEQGLDSVTGDKRVDKVLDGVKDLVHLYASAAMSPEESALADEIKTAVGARVEAGEDFEEAMAEELAKREDRLRAAMASHGEAPAAKAEEVPSRYNGDGLYL